MLKMLAVVLLVACGAPEVPEPCPSLRQVGQSCCPSEVNVPACEKGQAWICEPSEIAGPSDGGPQPILVDTWWHNGGC